MYRLGRYFYIIVVFSIIAVLVPIAACLSCAGCMDERRHTMWSPPEDPMNWKKDDFEKAVEQSSSLAEFLDFTEGAFADPISTPYQIPGFSNEVYWWKQESLSGVFVWLTIYRDGSVSIQLIEDR